MLESSFFVSGGTLPPSAPSYVERAADRALLEALASGRYAYVLNARQMGKSSLCVRTIARLEERGTRTAFVDLTRIGGRNVTAEQWYAGLLGEIGRGLGDRATLLSHWKAHPELGPMQRFFGALREATLASESPVVVFIDEIDATRSLPFSTDEFFAGIRECFNRRTQDPAMARLAFCLIGVAIPADLMSDAKLTPFNVGERIVLRDFSAAEAAALAAGLGSGGEAMMARIHHWTAGHPFLIQSLGRRAAEVGARTPADVDRLVAADLFEARARDTNVNLADVGNRVLNSYDDPEGIAKYRADVLSLYERVLKGKPVADDESNRLVAVLKLAGLVKTEGGTLRVRNPIYGRVFDRAWIEEHMPNQELRRQQRAYRRGVLRATLVGTGLSLAFATLGVAAVFNARRVNKALVQVQQARDDAKASEARAVQASKVANEAKGRLQVVADAREKALAAATASARRATQAKAEADRARNEALALARSQAETLSALQVQKRRADAQTVLARDNASAMRRSALEARESASEAERQNRQAYLSSVVAANALVEGNQVESARDLLRPFRDSRWRGWEYDHLVSRTVGSASLELAPRQGTVEAVAFVKNDACVLSGGADGLLAISDAQTGRRLRAFRPFAPGAAIRSLAVFRNGSSFVVAGSDGAIGRFALLESRPIWRGSGLGFNPNVVSASADGRWVAACGTGGNVVVLRGETGEIAYRYRLGDGQLGSIALSPRDATLVTGDEKRNLWVAKIDGEHGDPLTTPGDTQGVAWSPDGSLFAAVGGKGGGVWSLETRQLKHGLGPSASQAVAPTPDGQLWVVATSFGTCEMYDAKTGEYVRNAGSPGAKSLSSLGLSSDGQRAVVGDANGHTYLAPLGTVRAETTAFVRREPNYIVSLAATRNGRWIAYGFDAPTPGPGTPYAHIVVTDAEGRERRRIDCATSPASLDLSPDGRRVAANGQEVAAVYDVATGRRLLQVPGTLGAARFSPDGRRLALAETRAVGVYDGATLRPVRRIAFDALVRSVEFSPDGRTLAVGLESGMIELHPLDGATAPRQLLGQDYGVWTLDFSPDGRRLATGSGSSFSVYDVASGRKRVEMRMPWGSTAERALFSRDGRRIYTVSQKVARDASRVWDAESGQELTSLHHPGESRALALVGDDPVVGFTGEVIRYAGFGDADYRRLAATEATEARERQARTAEQAARQLKNATRARMEATVARGELPQALKIAQGLASRPDAEGIDGQRYAQLLARQGRYAEAARQWYLATGGEKQDLQSVWSSLVLNALANDRAAHAASLKRWRRLSMSPVDRSNGAILAGVLVSGTPQEEGARVDRIVREDPTFPYGRKRLERQGELRAFAHARGEV